MSEKIKVVFIGGLTNGKIVLEYFIRNKFIFVPLVITYPKEINKPRNVHIANIDGINRIVRDLDVRKYVNDIKSLNPEFIFVAGWSELLSKELISIPQKGTIGFHPSKLPLDRGRSILAWQIEEGYTETALTMFYYNEIPDCGDIIAQEKIVIEENDYISDILAKVDFVTYNLMRAYFPLLRKGIAPRRPQNLNEGNFRRLRTDKDSLINWDRNAKQIYNKIRAISKPYPGALIIYRNEKIRIWKSEISYDVKLEKLFTNSKPGEILAKFKNNYYLVKCKDYLLTIYAEKDLEIGFIL